MARERLCKVCGGWHELDEPWPDNCLPERNWTRSDLAAPMIIQDTMQAVQSQLDGKMYDSKSQLRATYKAAGVIEVGNDAPTKAKAPERPKATEVKATVAKAFSQAGLGA